MTREHAWCPRGERFFGSVPRNRGRVLTMLGAIAADGLRAMATCEGGTSGAVFLDFVCHHLVAGLRPGDIVVMDNLGAHHATGVKETIRAVGADVLFLPPYSPDLNPIELCWSKMKGVLRLIGARTVTTLRDAVAEACDAISTGDALAWFKSCGYPVPCG